jgi:hypothetical protein
MGRSKLPFLLVLVVFLPACLAQDLYMIRKTRKDRYGSGKAFARAIHEKVFVDKDNGPDSHYFTGLLRVDLASNVGTEDSKVRLTASAEQRSVSMMFWGVENDRLCFRSIFSEEVGTTGGGSRNYDPREYIDTLFRSYKFAAEYIGAYDSPAVQNRDHIFPKDNFTALDEVKLIDQKPVEKKGKQYLINSYEVCGKLLPAPAEQPKFLTVAVQSNNNADGGEYLLLWGLY